MVVVRMNVRLLAVALFLGVAGCGSTREPVAVVLGERIYPEELKSDDAAESLHQSIRGPIMRKYMREHELAVSDRELIALLERGGQAVAGDVLDPKSREFFRSIVESRLFAKSLFEEYGGRVTISSFGFTGALDAEETFLRRQMQDGVFTIFDPALEEAFWATVTKERGDATLSEDRAREMFNEPDFPMDSD